MILVVDMNCRRDSLGYYEFVLPIVRVLQPLERCAVKHYADVTSEDLAGCSRIILSGTTLEDNVTLTQPEKFQWLKTAPKPVLGICAGMQTIAVAFGMRLTRSLEIGMTQVATVKENPLFSGMFGAYSLHNFSAEPSDEFEALARSELCLQAFRHKEKKVFGVLFHPEVRNQDILKRFVELKQP